MIEPTAIHLRSFTFSNVQSYKCVLTPPQFHCFRYTFSISFTVIQFDELFLLFNAMNYFLLFFFTICQVETRSTNLVYTSLSLSLLNALYISTFAVYTHFIYRCLSDLCLKGMIYIECRYPLMQSYYSIVLVRYLIVIKFK